MKSLLLAALISFPSLASAAPLASWPKAFRHPSNFGATGWMLSPAWQVSKPAGMPPSWSNLLVGANNAADYQILSAGAATNQELRATVSLQSDNAGVYLWVRVAETNPNGSPMSGYLLFVTGGGIEEAGFRFKGTMPKNVRAGLAVIYQNKVYKMLADDVSHPAFAQWAWMNPAGAKNNGNVKNGKWDCQSEPKPACLQHWNVRLTARNKQISFDLSQMGAGPMLPPTSGLVLSFQEDTFQMGKAGVEFYNQAGAIQRAEVEVLP